MKILVLLATVTAVCAGSAIPAIPKDNSHYVEGESRFIWMSDSEGVPHLVDLHRQVDQQLLTNSSGALNQYWLFTRQNPYNYQMLVHGNASSISNSNYLNNRTLNVIVHGWMGSGDSSVTALITSALLAIQDCNVIVVDWGQASAGEYDTVFNNVPSVGQFLGNFLVWLINTGGGDWNNVHLIGASLGAHVVGIAGRTGGGRAARLTALDPARPQWIGNSNAMNSNDAQYVEAIHTDGDVSGIFNRVGNTDFYPNGGKNPQPGCSTNECSHVRAPNLFASSVRNNHFYAKQCDNIDLVSDPSQCTGSSFRMGNADMNKQGCGIYGLTTEATWPF